ncbi:MAG: EAL domain-containing protein [Granulosicoccus sp.]
MIIKQIPSTQESLDLDDQALRLMGNAKIMMVDDEPINMRVLQLHLTAEGYERFVTVSDSTIALSVMRSEKPNVLLLDLNMPVVSGLDILEQIRNDDELKQLPIIVLTSSNNADTKFSALKLGATDFLSKPVHAGELALRMRNTLVARAYEQQIMHMDTLTNLPNRLFFADYMQRHFEQPPSNQSHNVLVLINLHRFKSINDSYGSDRGDDVLWAFSQRLCAAFIATDKDIAERWGNTDARESLVMRLGGDRFGVFVETGPNPEEDPFLMDCLDALVTSVEEPFVIESQNVYINLGIGISIHEGKAQCVENLINHAETAMKHQHNGVTTPFAFYTVDMIAGARRKMDIENALRTAIADEGLYLTYQPKVDVRSGLISGAEALLRWNQSLLGHVSPVEFIPVAESSGLIVSVGQWVLETACEQAVAFRAAGFPDFKIAVNVSIAQLYEPDFIDVVRQTLANTGLPSDALIIELTENMIMENVEGSISQLALLREQGVRISIDDFGTGYSSLSYLQRFPINQLKIDRSFIMQIDSAAAFSPIVKAIVMLAHDLNLDVVAEGVETAEQLSYIRRLSCGEYQGNYKSRPVVADKFFQLLSEGKSRAA